MVSYSTIILILAVFLARLSMPLGLTFAVLIGMAALWYQRYRGIPLWPARRAGALILCVTALSAAGALAYWGPSQLYTSADRARSVDIGIVGFVMPATSSRIPGGPESLTVQLAVDPSYAPVREGTPRLILPWSGATHANNSSNSLIELAVDCRDGSPTERCMLALSLQPGPPPRDYLAGARRTDGEPWALLGSIVVPDAAVLEIKPLSGNESGARRDQRMQIRIDAKQVRFGDCTVPRSENETFYLTVLDLYFLETRGACHLLPLNADAQLDGRWLQPRAQGGTEIPAHSFFSISSTAVRYFPLENAQYRVELLGPGGELPTESVKLDFDSKGVSLALFWRRFRTHALAADKEAECLRGSRSLSECHRITVQLEPQLLSLQHEALRHRFQLQIDKNSPSWRSQAYTQLVPESFKTESGRPREYVYYQGSATLQSASLRNQGDEERFLHVPFRMEGVLPYKATMMLTSPGANGSDSGSSETGDPTLLVRDASLRTLSYSPPLRFELGQPGEVAALVEFERTPDPLRITRAWMLPSLIALLGLIALYVLYGQLGRLPLSPKAVSVAALFLLLNVYATLHKAVIAYAVSFHPPYDWEGYDQATLAAWAIPMMPLAGLGLGQCIAARRWNDTGHWRDWTCVFTLAALSVIRWVMSFMHKEAIGSFRVVVLLPVIAALMAYCVSRSLRPESVLRIHRPVVVWLLLFFAVGAWFTDKGALLLVALPTAALLVVHVYFYTERKSSPALKFLSVVPALSAFCLFLIVAFPVLLVGGWLWWSDDLRLPRLDPMPASFCAEGSTLARSSGAAEPAECKTGATPEGSAVLDELDRRHLIDPMTRIAERRHPLRRLDWLNDGASDGHCRAVDRLPTRDGLEVGYFRALILHYLANRHSPGEDAAQSALPVLSRGVTDALLNDYLGVVAYVPRLPRGTMAAISITTLVLWLIALMLNGRPTAARALPKPRFGRSSPYFPKKSPPVLPPAPADEKDPSEPHPVSSPSGAWTTMGLAVLTLFAGAQVLTTAANLDVYPNFAQSIPLLAIRSNSAWLLDGLCILITLCALTVGWSEDALARRSAQRSRVEPQERP